MGRTRVAASLPPLLQFVLRHLRARSMMGSRQRLERGYTLAPRTVRAHNLIHVTRGRVVWVIGGVEHPLGPGDLLVVPPGVPHHAFSRTRRITLFSIHIAATLPGGRDAFELAAPPRVQRVPGGCRLDRYLRHACDEYDRPTVEEAWHTMDPWAGLLARELLLHGAATGTLTYRDLDPVVAGTLDELRRRLAKPTTLADLAAHSGYSAQHLNRLFGRVLGVTPLQHLTRLRLEHAAELLRSGTLTVAAVAAASGFDDPYYFSRVFHRHAGRSPDRYRREACSDSPAPPSADPWPPAPSRL